MKNNIIENIRLEMKRQKSTVRTSVKVGDVLTRTLHITLSDSGELVSLENALIVEIFIKKPDGKECYNNCVISGDEIQYTLTSQSINVPGICTCWLMITFEDGAVVQSPEFSIVVYEPKINPNVIRSQNEYTALTAQVLMAKNYAKEAEKAVGKIGDAEANSSACADRAEGAENRAKKHADRVEDVKSEVVTSAEKAETAAANAQASEKAAKEYAEEVRDAVVSVLDAENNVGILVRSATDAVGNVENVAEDIRNVYSEVQELEKNAIDAESNAKSHAQQAEKCRNEFVESLTELEAQNQVAYEHTQAVGGNPHGVSQKDVGLDNVDNTADADKPVSTVQREAIDAVQAELERHAGTLNVHTSTNEKSNWNTAYEHSEAVGGNPHGVSQKDVGLDNVDNTADADKPVSTAQQRAIDSAYQNAVAYADKVKSDIMGGLPSEALDTITELAEKLENGSDALNILVNTVGGKVGQAEMDTHTGNLNIHTTTTEKNKWNSAYEHSQNIHSVEQGGTGQTTEQKAMNSFINALPVGENTPNDNDYFVSQYVGGGLTQVDYYRRKFFTIWSYISDKIKSVLGLTSSNYSGNAATATKWANARNINGMSVQGDANRVNYGVCSTAAATATKTVSCTGFSLVTGAEITVKFTVTNTASSPTLNVNGTGAKPIYYRGASISAGYLAANRTYTFRYSGTQWEFVGDINTDINSEVEELLKSIGYPRS